MGFTLTPAEYTTYIATPFAPLVAPAPLVGIVTSAEIALYKIALDQYTIQESSIQNAINAIFLGPTAIELLKDPDLNYLPLMMQALQADRASLETRFDQSRDFKAILANHPKCVVQ